jgi:hypothetical protein
MNLLYALVFVVAAPRADLSSSTATLAQQALQSARQNDGAVVELLGLEGESARCAPVALAAAAPVVGSGRVTLRVEGITKDGTSCGGFLSARVRVLVPQALLSRDVKKGELIAESIDTPLREAKGTFGFHSFVPGKNARAARDLKKGHVLQRTDAAVGPPAGTAVSVIVRSGSLELTESGRTAACPANVNDDAVCAVLRGGRRVAGNLDDRGDLIVEIQ